MLQVPAARTASLILACSEENVLFYFAVERFKDDKRFDTREQHADKGTTRPCAPRAADRTQAGGAGAAPAS